MGAGLSLNGLKTLSPETALELGKVGGDLYLNGLEHLSSETAEMLFSTFRICSSDRKINPIPWANCRYRAEVAYMYNRFHLEGIAELDLAAASEMVEFGGTIILTDHCQISVAVQKTLKKRNSIRIVKSALSQSSTEVPESSATCVDVATTRIPDTCRKKWWQLWAR